MCKLKLAVGLMILTGVLTGCAEDRRSASGLNVHFTIWCPEGTEGEIRKSEEGMGMQACVSPEGEIVGPYVKYRKMGGVAISNGKSEVILNSVGIPPTK